MENIKVIGEITIWQSNKEKKQRINNEVKKIKSYNYTKSNREKSKYAIVIMEKIMIW